MTVRLDMPKEIEAQFTELNIGSSVAEFGEALDKYFVETEAFRALSLDRADIIAVNKGQEKTP